ncbi:MAG: hypothetical protein CMH12_18140 [Maritimibacter sp.]|nr:hypothetical protein [Maritimibacter sp.]
MRTPPTGLQAEFPDDAQIRQYGDLAFLYLRSVPHQRWSVSDLRRAMQPPVDLGQLRIFYHEGAPRAAFTFALLNPETEAKLISGQMLDPSDWRSGTIFWVVEMIMPYGQHTGADMVRWLKAHLPDTVDRVRYLRTKRADRPAKVIEVRRIEGAHCGARVLDTHSSQHETT